MKVSRFADAAWERLPPHITRPETKMNKGTFEDQNTSLCQATQDQT
jgi:hypothetical protein